ncbi:MAG: helix-turn-helix transcriptional regulator [Planctomycetaceae bacterium]|nr:helix-turn-helix transcriptional regulator [Planctomycetaceae bacterium]MCA9042808.1 helix-turn-helix transcriptional regulator [Planctomycetaceae bacterium]
MPSRRPKPCPAKASLQSRPLMSEEFSQDVEALFEVLANDSRLRLLHQIAREGEICTSDLAAAVDMKPQAVSNQLKRLHDKRIVGSRRDGNNVFYRIIDNCVIELMERAICLVEEGIADR